MFSSQPGVAFLLALVVLLAGTMSAYAGHAVWVRKVEPGTVFFGVQAAVDLILVLALVHYGQGASTALASLFVVLIAGYALLMPGTGGGVVTLVALLLYLLDRTLVETGVEIPILLGQLAVFAFVFLMVSVLSRRLQVAATEQSKLKHELQRIRLEADEILRSIRTGVMTVDGHGRLAFMNPTAERLLELNGERLLGRPVLDSLKARAPDLHAAMVAGLDEQDRVTRGEGLVHRADGTSFPIGLSTTTFERQLESLPAVTAIFTDISDSIHIQELRSRAERLEAVAALSASLAHEIRNPLASIRSSVEQLARSVQADDDDRTLGQLIVRESDRLSRLLSEFLDFSRVSVHDFSRVNLYAVAVQAVTLVREHPDCGAGVVVRVAGDQVHLDADEDLLHRIVTNLVLNAVQACEGKGEVLVTIDQPSPAALPIGSDIHSPVRLQIQDDGPGIEPDLRERLFQPFVSGRAGGSGLGLAIVQRAVEAHRGLVLLESTPGRGTTFTIFFHATWRTEEPA